ncbi:MAG: hypothetical protein IKF91_01615 [Bacilli bacterium]|nr:hypothetical protein [Bacilli bacterium]
MQELYYDRWEFLQAYNLIHNNPIMSKKLFEEYIQKYPSDYSAQNYYVYLLIVLGMVEEADVFLDNIEQSMRYNSKFCNHFDKIEFVDKGIFLNRIRIFARKEEYKELYSYFIRNIHLFEDSDLQVISFYCRSKLGLLRDKEYSSYLYRQIANYNSDEFLKHIERHTANYNTNLDKPNSSIFSCSFPLEKVLDEIRKYIPSDKGLGYGFFEDTYVFKYDECGKCRNKLTDYFKVVCFHENNNLVTMCPSEDSENLPYTDLNYLIKEDKPKVKTLSQIEKFNRRYRR